MVLPLVNRIEWNRGSTKIEKCRLTLTFSPPGISNRIESLKVVHPLDLINYCRLILHTHIHIHSVTFTLSHSTFHRSKDPASDWSSSTIEQYCCCSFCSRYHSYNTRTPFHVEGKILLNWTGLYLAVTLIIHYNVMYCNVLYCTILTIYTLCANQNSNVNLSLLHNLSIPFHSYTIHNTLHRCSSIPWAES